MQLIDRIEDQMAATSLPLVSITLAAVPCPDTPIILTLHWHGFLREKIADVEGAKTVAYTPVPSSALQVNERWGDVASVDQATLDAAWRLGAWDVSREERRPCARKGATTKEPLECLQAFGAYPYGVNGQQLTVSDAPDSDELLTVAARRGYLCWKFRPVKGGIWNEVAADATLTPDGHREGPCPMVVTCERHDGGRQCVYRLGIPRAEDLAGVS